MHRHRKMVVFFRTLKRMYIVCCGMQCVYVFIVAECRSNISYALLVLQIATVPLPKACLVAITIVQIGKSQLSDTFLDVSML